MSKSTWDSLLKTQEELEVANPGLKFHVSDDPRFGFSGFTSQCSPKENEMRPCVEGRTHCWHGSPIQHALMYHHDELCCRCGQARCVSLPHLVPGGHGPHWPGIHPRGIAE